MRRTNRECLILLEGFVPPFTSVNLSIKLKLVALAQLRKPIEHAKSLNLETVSLCFRIFCAS
ncbi:hypothetical protein THF1C08_700001 [Vibrio jasicida]|uniref:Uncharacterized protein n=1 Tax=Vibrio jasicida TaxID=766224 RepID=A0AAU9QXL1_9VIBR|nr:hypothetical protein THF1C08_700001 [Vibrio jasicida]CAH1603569.1 hypothetical protein THF1A12_720001 [Vibrio jasicida]